jgi:hypothetical protein
MGIPNGCSAPPATTFTERMEAFPWDSAPRYLIRDRDTAYSLVLRAAFARHGHSRQAGRFPIAVAEPV